MRSSFYEKLSNTAIAVLDLVEHTPKEMVITRINVPHEFRGRGVASRLLAQVIKEADFSGITLSLNVQSSGGLNDSQLDAWYRRHDFSGSGLLQRKPK